MKLRQRVTEARLQREVTISEQQCGFLQTKSSSDVMFKSVDGEVQPSAENFSSSFTASLCIWRKQMIVLREELWCSAVVMGQVDKWAQAAVSVDYNVADDMVICSESREQGEESVNSTLIILTANSWSLAVSEPKRSCFLCTARRQQLTFGKR